ncbi:MAG: helix-turn-helix domain-containing protein [Oscillospiraceae bacterium]|nr:helix-turn-helix domain-containing protein [Oscillospiraceae bacterium]
MAREKQDYRANLELIQQMFPGRVALTITETCAVTGLDRRTLLKDREFPARQVGNKYSIPVTALARYLS